MPDGIVRLRIAGGPAQGQTLTISEELLRSGILRVPEPMEIPRFAAESHLRPRVVPIAYEYRLTQDPIRGRGHAWAHPMWSTLRLFTVRRAVSNALFEFDEALRSTWERMDKELRYNVWELDGGVIDQIHIEDAEDPMGIYLDSTLLETRASVLLTN